MFVAASPSDRHATGIVAAFVAAGVQEDETDRTLPSPTVRPV
jgi:hypothetical protein